MKMGNDLLTRVRYWYIIIYCVDDGIESERRSSDLVGAEIQGLIMKNGERNNNNVM